MKSLKIWSLIALFAMALVGCGGDDDTNNGDGKKPIVQTDIYGKWQLASVSDCTPEFGVYIEFTKDGKFNLYQQVWTLTYEHYTGTFNVNGDVLSGEYSDGSAWTGSYNYSVANSKLTLTNVDNSDEVNVYNACVIPQEVIDEATTTRSEEVVPFL